METAKYIAEVLGGPGQIRMMTGCKVYGIKEENGSGGLTLADLPNSKYQFVEIKYMPGPDLFSVKFTRIRKFKIIEEKLLTDLYVDQLKSLIESETGLYLTLR